MALQGKLKLNNKVDIDEMAVNFSSNQISKKMLALNNFFNYFGVGWGTDSSSNSHSCHTSNPIIFSEQMAVLPSTLHMHQQKHLRKNHSHSHRFAKKTQKNKTPQLFRGPCNIHDVFFDSLEHRPSFLGSSA